MTKNKKQEIDKDFEKAGTGKGEGNPVVLLVDDQMMIAEGIRRMLLDETDIEFHYCDDPKKALELAIEIKPTIILQDLIMPDVDGYTLVDDYRDNSETRDIPVIVLSTKEDPEDKSLAFERGADDYLVKPPNKIELCARIRANSQKYIKKVELANAYRAMRKLQEELEETNKELQKLSSLDGLTGIANRRKFDEFLKGECLRSARDNSILSLLLIDIDFFKPYNDNYGHLAGDGCLRKVATALTEVVNRPADLVARYGGEEFGVVLPNTDIKGASQIAESLCKKVSALAIQHEFSEAAEHVTVSIGVASLVACEGSKPAELINTADDALYNAKESGRNKYKVAGSK